LEFTQCADYTLGTRQVRKGGSLARDLGGNSAGGGAKQKPFCGASDAAPGAAAACKAQGVVAFVRESGGFLALVD